MTANSVIVLTTLAVASSGFLGFVAVKRGPVWLQAFNDRVRQGVARSWFLLRNGIGWIAWLALTALWAVGMLEEGEPLIVVAFIAPLFALLMGLAALIVIVFVLALLLGWFLLLASISSSLRQKLRHGGPHRPRPGSVSFLKLFFLPISQLSLDFRP